MEVGDNMGYSKNEASFDPREATLIALDESVIENLNTCDGGIYSASPEQAVKLWENYEEMLEDDRENYIGILGERIFEVYKEIARAAKRSFESLSSSGKRNIPINVNLSSGLKNTCVKPKKQMIGLPTEDLPPLQRELVEKEKTNILRKRFTCKPTLKNTANIEEVKHPWLEDLAEAIKYRCDHCPYEEK